MRLLLDTCALLWLVLSPEKLSPKARATMADREAEIFVSAISALEIAIKHAKGKLSLPTSPSAWLGRAMDVYGLHEVVISSTIALHAPLVRVPHGDPADRIILATAIQQDMTIVTADARLLACTEARTIS
jgi:PIN domain nuclease of toxin-antitoxin system